MVSASQSSMPRTQKIIIGVGVVLIVALALFAVIPLVYSAMTGPGDKTEPLDASGASAATTDLNGEWSTVRGKSPNYTSVGYTFDEVLPVDARTTSGSTQKVFANVTIENNTVTAGDVKVDLVSVNSDKQVRDENVRRKLLHTDKFPEATFKLTKPVDVSQLPDDGTPAKVTLTGDLTVLGKPHPITNEFDVVRDGKHLVVGGTIKVNREDFGIESPEMIAAEIADQGEINIMLSMTKDEKKD